MRFRLRYRSARRKAALRVLQEMSQSEQHSDNRPRIPQANTLPPKPSAAVITDDRSDIPNHSLYVECAGRPYLIGPGTLLVAAYLERMQQCAASTECEEDLQEQKSR